MYTKKWFSNIVTLLLATLLVGTQPVWSAPISSVSTAPRAALNAFKSTISYQGYLVDANGNPVNAAALAMVFKLYNVASGGVALWAETQNVAVSNGLFSVELGATTPFSTSMLANNNDLWLGITIGSDTEMSPREKIASAPYALLANVPDGSITEPKLAASAVTSPKIQDDTITSADVNDNSLTANDLAVDSVGPSELKANSVGASELVTDSVGTSEVNDNTLTSDDLATNSVGASELAADSVGTSEVNDNTLTSDDLATNSVGASELAADSVGASELAANSVGASELATDSVGTSEVDDNALTSSDLAPAAVKADELDPTAFDKLVIKPFDFSLGCRNDYGNGHAGCERRYNFTSAFPNKTLFVTASIHLAGNEVFWHWIPVGVYNVDKTGFDLGFVTYTDAGAVGWYNQTNTRVVGYAVGY